MKGVVRHRSASDIMIKKLKLSTFEGALRVGGFIGWYFTVMYICEHSLLPSVRTRVIYLNIIPHLYLYFKGNTEITAPDDLMHPSEYFPRRFFHLY